jgi:hypothetical protein
MSLFSRQSGSGSPDDSDDTIPINAIDLSKRYDLYCTTQREERLYEDMKIVGIRTFERMRQYSSGLIGGYIEIEARDSTRMLLSHHQVRMICEHGSQPKYKVLKTYKTDDDA